MKKQTISDSGFLKKILIHGCSAALISAILAMVCAYLVVQQVIDKTAITYLTPTITVVSVLICALLSAKNTKEKKMLITLGTAAVYFVITLIAKMAFFPGECTHMLRNGLLCMTAALVSAVITCLPKKKKRFSSVQRR